MDDFKARQMVQNVAEGHDGPREIVRSHIAIALCIVVWGLIREVRNLKYSLEEDRRRIRG